MSTEKTITLSDAVQALVDNKIMTSNSFEKAGQRPMVFHNAKGEDIKKGRGVKASQVPKGGYRNTTLVSLDTESGEIVCHTSAKGATAEKTARHMFRLFSDSPNVQVASPNGKQLEVVDFNTK